MASQKLKLEAPVQMPSVKGKALSNMPQISEDGEKKLMDKLRQKSPDDIQDKICEINENGTGEKTCYVSETATTYLLQEKFTNDAASQSKDKVESQENTQEGSKTIQGQ